VAGADDLGGVEHEPATAERMEQGFAVVTVGEVQSAMRRRIVLR
jgi:hypothetical protein